MADAKPKAGKPSNPWHDVLWFFGIMAAFFFLWVWGGGPERAKENPPSPVLNGDAQKVSPAPSNATNPNNNSSSNTSPANNTSRPTNPNGGAGQSGQSGGGTSGQIQVTPL